MKQKWIAGKGCVRDNASMDSNAHLFPLEHTGPLTNPYEGLIIGNGDLAVSALVFSHELRLTLGKNDVWDSRLDTRTDEVVLKQDDLIRYSREYGFHEERAAVGSLYYDWPGRPDDLQICNFGLGVPGVTGESRWGPSPKPVGCIRLIHPGLSDTPVTSRVDIAHGTLSSEYGFPEGKLLVEAFVHRSRNTVMVRLAAEGEIPWVSVLVEKTPDGMDPSMPLPVISSGADKWQWAISQTIPGRFDVSDFAWHVAAVFGEKASSDQRKDKKVAAEDYVASDIRSWAYSLQQDVRLASGESVVLSLGVATDRDGEGEALSRALALACGAQRAGYVAERKSHWQGWSDFWSASSISLQDKELESLWYRSLYGFACHMKPGAQAPGLNANIPFRDGSSWHGFYTWNHNVQKWYFAAGAVNHCEWYDVLADLIDQHTPMFTYLAELIFGLEGVYCDLMSFPFQPPHRALTHSKQGRALAHTGWLSLLLFQGYEYSGDRSWLEKRAYPYIKKAADFYAAYLEKYQGPDGDIYPSIRLEDSGWGKDFLGNRNVVTDLVMFRKGFEVAIAASEALEVDDDARQRWRDAAKRVPRIEHGWRQGRGWYALCKDWEQIWPDFDDYLYHSRYSRWGCGAWLVFPGEYVGGDEPDGLTAVVRDLVGHVDLKELPPKMTVLGTFHGEATVTPYIRLGLMDHFEDVRRLMLNHRYASGLFSPYSTGTGEYVRTAYISGWRIMENQYMPLLGVTEMLLQSQGDVLRLFPYWPREERAAFQDLRARGGFLVSASTDPQEGVQATITSLIGHPCRLRWKEDGQPRISRNEKPVPLDRRGEDLVFMTEAGGRYEIVSG